MSRQPIRVAQPPTATQTSATQSRTQKSYRNFNSRSNTSSSTKYEDLIKIAERQRRLIDANRRTIQQREARGNRVENAPVRLAVLRNEVAYEEREMARLKKIERDTHEAASNRLIAERQLNELQINYTSQEQHLRDVISKVSSLQAQLDVLRRRRLTALNAAREQQQKMMTSQMRPPFTRSLAGVNSASSSAVTSNNDIILRNDVSKSSLLLSQQQNPASENGRTKQRNSMNNDNSLQRRIPTILESGRPKYPASDFPDRPRASVEPFQVTRPKPAIVTGRELASSCPPQLPLKQSYSVATFGKDKINHNMTEQRVLVNRDISPSPPKDPYPTTDGSASSEFTEIEERKTKPTEHQKNSSNQNTLVETQTEQSSKNLVKFGGDKNFSIDELPTSDLMDSTKLTKADQISIRPDTLRAAKRRSWALQDCSPSDETDYIRKVLLDEQKKGRTHLLVGCNIGNLLSTTSKATQQPVNKPEIIHEEAKESDENVICTTPTIEEHDCEALMKDIKLDEVPIEIVERVEESLKEQIVNSREEATEEDFEMEEAEVEDKISGIAELLKPRPEKGILRSGDARKTSRKVIFDPLALLLDAALEGEMDLVKASAAKLPNISACNDEGITALHNAICAGHYEIVRYLVDSLADVNAQDSDGWTPLHCAASCNNLPMVKLLVENGACIFAQTLSDLETPAEKCEEDEDGYEGCQLYLKAAHQGAGVVNGGCMYAAYDYDKEQEDELSFRAGACLRVLKKCVDGQAWWRCEIVSSPEESITVEADTSNGSSEIGLVPRNYLSLYPSLAKRNSEFKMFDLPQIRNQDSKELEEKEKMNEQKMGNNRMDIKNKTKNNRDETVVEQPVSISVS